MTARRRSAPRVPEDDAVLPEVEQFEMELEAQIKAHLLQERARRAVQIILDAEEDAAESEEALRVSSLAELRRLIDPEPLWDGWLYQGSPAIMAARGGLGKSALVLGLACAVYHGLPNLGSDVRQGKVLYVAGEGHRSIAKRIEAWERYHHVKPRSTRIGVIYDQTLTTD
jgi:RecA-family ATPase